MAMLPLYTGPGIANMLRNIRVRVDFTNNAYYFTGNSTNLAATGAYINVSVVGTTQFQMTSLPRLYRNTTTVIEARLLDNSLQPLQTSTCNMDLVT